MRIFENVPELLQPGDSKIEWEAHRENMIDTIANIEYGCRPEVNYTVNWNLLSREAVLDGKAERIRLMRNCGEASARIIECAIEDIKFERRG